MSDKSVEKMTFEELSVLLGGDYVGAKVHQEKVGKIFIDSRKASLSTGDVFFAIKGLRNDGHDYISLMHKQGLKLFVVEPSFKNRTFKYPEASFIIVESAKAALQRIAAYRRSMLKCKVVGITGSNGKTIVKEWLSDILSEKHIVTKSPKSFNSQVGVPLSVLELNEQTEIGVFEAGISQAGEMQRLEMIIKPDFGIFTNIGSAHDQGFESRIEKTKEKMKLFSQAKRLVYCLDYSLVHQVALECLGSERLLGWSYTDQDADVYVDDEDGKVVFYPKGESSYEIFHDFLDDASKENLIHSVVLAKYLGMSIDEINLAVKHLPSVDMRLSIKDGINHCCLIDDSYNNDLAGLEVALDFMRQMNQKSKSTLILSDMHQTGLNVQHWRNELLKLIKAKKVDKLIGIGPEITLCKDIFNGEASYFASTDDFLNSEEVLNFDNETILVKGARHFHFERIIKALEKQVHGTRLEVNMESLVHNLNFYKSRLKKDTKLMIMVKAFAYGNGSFEIASLLQYHRVDYLGVAYADEGVALRKHGINIPIMVMNPTEDDFLHLLKYNLEPEIYSFDLLDRYCLYLKKNERQSRIHIKLDTGMHRLGFVEKDLDRLGQILSMQDQVEVQGYFTHLAAADVSDEDEYTVSQLEQFSTWFDHMAEYDIKGDKMKYALNTAGIIRFPEYQFDMVRLGIGLYGIDSTGMCQRDLRLISVLKTRISQIHDLKEGNTIGYSRKGVLAKNSRIATMAIGYADGFCRLFSNGRLQVKAGGKLAPVIGNVCMDMTMIDITGIDDVEVGDEVIIFESADDVNRMAEAAMTIPYEVMTNIGSRVKRVFYAD